MPARAFVSVPDTAWIFHRLRPANRPAPLHPAGGLVRRAEEPWIILTDLPPEEAGPSWYALRFWIELGLPSRAWAGSGTRPGAPTRPASPHWPVLSVATLLALAYGTRVEDAQGRIDPSNLRAPQGAGSQSSGPSDPSATHRKRNPPRQLAQAAAQGSPFRVWLLPEPWPEPKPNLEVTHHAPS